MNSCVIFGGSGFVGTHLVRRFLRTGRFSQIHIADLRPTPLAQHPGVSYSRTDVRQTLGVGLPLERPDWIFNLAAIHREPGHQPWEYYDTNIPGARNVCGYAEAVGCNNVYFTSSIAVYGPTTGPADEDSALAPATPYGGSKYAAETIHRMWRRARQDCRLIISRPGVLYGPGDPGNIMRMIKAIRNGYFAFPGSPSIHKSYGYISGFADSVEFAIDSDERELTYNYAEAPTQPLGEIVETIKSHFDCRALVLPIPLWTLLPAARLVQAIFGERNPVHPVRVRKAATPTHIVPRRLVERGFDFKYSFLDSLRHWQSIAPKDFGLPTVEGTRRLTVANRKAARAADESVQSEKAAARVSAIYE